MPSFVARYAGHSNLKKRGKKTYSPDFTVDSKNRVNLDERR
jgi:hypothetical protein